MLAVLLVGHGSLRAGAGAAMIRLAGRVREAGVAPIVAAGFLNYSRPTFAEALKRCVARGATAVVVQPYFLVPGKFVREDVPGALRVARSAYPRIRFALAQPFGDHPALARLVLKRAAEAALLAEHPQLLLSHVHGEQGTGQWPALRLGTPVVAHAGGVPWDLDGGTAQTGLLIMGHGSPDPAANQPIQAVAERIRHDGRYAAVAVSFLDLNQPSIPAAIGGLVAQGIRRIIAVPFFLQLGGHVAKDLPAIIDAARLRHPAATILLAQHLAYDRLLISVITDRVRDIEERSSS
jgi:sirohydrochlorin cobaltochelatase